MIINFYNDDEIIAGKELLMKAVTQAAKHSNVDLDLPREARETKVNSP